MTGTGDPTTHPSFPRGRGSYRPARRTRRQAKAVCTEGCARRWSSPVVLASACGQDKPRVNRATRRTATPVNGCAYERNRGRGLVWG
jgi:hypothetical protein